MRCLVCNHIFVSLDQGTSSSSVDAVFKDILPTFLTSLTGFPVLTKWANMKGFPFCKQCRLLAVSMHERYRLYEKLNRRNVLTAETLAEKLPRADMPAEAMPPQLETKVSDGPEHEAAVEKNYYCILSSLEQPSTSKRTKRQIYTPLISAPQNSRTRTYHGVPYYECESKFICALCKSFSTNTKYSIDTHIRVIHLNGAPAKVKQSGIKEVSPNKFRYHNLMAEKRGDLLHCCHCNYTTLHLRSMRNHLYSCHLERPKKVCEVCGETFKMEKSFRWHMRSRHGTGKLRHGCTICGSTYKYRASLRNHMERHTKASSSATPRLNSAKSFYLGFQLEEHDDGFTCTTCDYNTNTKNAVMGHIRMKHVLRVHERRSKVVEAFVEVAPGEFKYHNLTATKSGGEFRCGHCDFAAKTKRIMRTHLWQVHLDRSRYECKICGKILKYKNSLDLHMEGHRESGKNESWKCRHCDKSFSKALKLKNHERRVHRPGKIKRFVCTVCGSRFGTKVQLKAHSYKHTGDKLFKCDVCARSFVSWNGLYAHMNHHTGRKVYACDICGVKLTQPHSVTRHKALVHKVEKKGPLPTPTGS